MERKPPLVIDLPPLSDKSVVEIHQFLQTVTEVFEACYSLQIWRYYDKNPRLPRPAKFTGEPF